MTIRTKLNFKDYLNLMYILTYKKLFVILLSIAAFIPLLLAGLSYLGIFHNKDFEHVTKAQLLVSCIVLIAFPLSIYWSTRKNFNSNKKIRESITYVFSDEHLTITGETFSSELNLNSSYKIEELKDWFLIYPSNRIANLIPKSNLSYEEVVKLRNIFESLIEVKLKLKKN